MFAHRSHGYRTYPLSRRRFSEESNSSSTQLPAVSSKTRGHGPQNTESMFPCSRVSFPGCRSSIARACLGHGVALPDVRADTRVAQEVPAPVQVICVEAAIRNSHMRFPATTHLSTVRLPAVSEPNRWRGTQYCEDGWRVFVFSGFQGFQAHEFPSSLNSPLLKWCRRVLRVAQILSQIGCGHLATSGMIGCRPGIIF